MERWNPDSGNVLSDGSYNKTEYMETSVGEVTTGIWNIPKIAAANLWRHNALVSRRCRKGIT